VVWVRVDADQALGLDLEAGLLPDLADDGPGDGLADLHRAAGDRPQLVVAAAVQQDPAVLVDDDRGGPGDERVGAGRVGVVVVVDVGHDAVSRRWALVRGRPR